MKRFLIAIVLIGVAVALMDELGDMTQTRPDRVPRNSRTTLIFEVDTRKYAPGADMAADNLWASCAHLTWSRVINGGPVSIGNERYEVVLKPGLGAYSKRKVVGCIEDITIDRVMADVESVTLALDPPAAPAAAAATRSPSG